MLNDDMAEGVPRERRATLCRDEGNDRYPIDPTGDVQKTDNCARGCDFTHGCASSNFITKQVVDDANIRASQQQFVRGCEQRRGDREYSQRYMQRRQHKRHGHARGRFYDCGQFGHFRREYEHARASRYSLNVHETRY